MDTSQQILLILFLKKCIGKVVGVANSSASKNTDSSVFYTEIETKILNTDSDPQNTDRDPII